MLIKKQFEFGVIMALAEDSKRFGIFLIFVAVVMSLLIYMVAISNVFPLMINIIIRCIAIICVIGLFILGYRMAFVWSKMH